MPVNRARRSRLHKKRQAYGHATALRHNRQGRSNNEDPRQTFTATGFHAGSIHHTAVAVRLRDQRLAYTRVCPSRSNATMS